MRLLVAENDSDLGNLLQRGFNSERYAVDLTQNGQQAKNLVQENEYDLVILDLSLPKDEGLSILQDVRLSHQQLPILVLANAGQILDAVRELECAADDFALKPFCFSELSTRVRMLLRRGGRYPEVLLRVEDLELNRVQHSVKRANRVIELTPKEFAMLEFLMRNSAHPVTRAQIIQYVWNISSSRFTNIVEVYINYLRKKVDAVADRKLIHTIRGIGYQLNSGYVFGDSAVQRRASVGTD
jgi:DNA-binding response OmpR family regulator